MRTNFVAEDSSNGDFLPNMGGYFRIGLLRRELVYMCETLFCIILNFDWVYYLCRDQNKIVFFLKKSTFFQITNHQLAGNGIEIGAAFRISLDVMVRYFLGLGSESVQFSLFNLALNFVSFFSLFISIYLKK